MTPIETVEGCVLVENGWGGNRPLPVRRFSMFDSLIDATSWIPTDTERDLLVKGGAINLVVAKDAAGNISYSMKVLEVVLVPDH